MQHSDIPELLTLACTIARWESEPACAVLAGVTNARSESLNRIAKPKAAGACSKRDGKAINAQIARAEKVAAGKAPLARTRFLKVTGASKDWTMPPSTGLDSWSAGSPGSAGSGLLPWSSPPRFGKCPLFVDRRNLVGRRVIKSLHEVFWASV